MDVFSYMVYSSLLKKHVNISDYYFVFKVIFFSQSNQSFNCPVIFSVIYI